MRIMTAIMVKCKTDEELNGMYKAVDVRKELESLNIKFVNWLDWVFDHLFMNVEGWHEELQDIVTNKATEEVVLRVGQHNVKFIKFYNIKG